MTPQLTRLGKMLALVALFVLISTVSAETSADSFPESYILYRINDHHAVTTGIHRDFAVVDCYKNQSDQSLTSVKIRIIGQDYNNATKTECSVPFSKISSSDPLLLYRLNQDSILMVQLGVDNNTTEKDDSLMKLSLLYMNNCTYTDVSEGINIPISLQFLPSNNNQSVNDFSVIVRNVKFCQNYQYCRAFFNPFYYKTEPLYFDFSYMPHYFKSVQSVDGNIFSVGFIWDSTYDIRLYNYTDNTFEFTPLFELGDYDSDKVGSPYNLISSFLSHCWKIVQPNHSIILHYQSIDTKFEATDKLVKCKAFAEDGNDFLYTKLIYPNSVEIQQVQSIPNGLIVITKSAPCLDGCTTVRVVLLRRNFIENSLEMKYRQFQLECVVLFPLQLNLSNSTFEIDYICGKEKLPSIRFIKTDLQSFESSTLPYDDDKITNNYIKN